MRRKNIQTPWGYAQTQELLEHGIISVSTASHGGFFVPHKALMEMPEPYRHLGEPCRRINGFGLPDHVMEGVTFSNMANDPDFDPIIGAWFEEDCAVSAVIASFPDMALAMKVINGQTGYQYAVWQLMNWYPVTYEEATGELPEGHVPRCFGAVELSGGFDPCRYRVYGVEPERILREEVVSKGKNWHGARYHTESAATNALKRAYRRYRKAEKQKVLSA